jgi:hypothetical protein
MVPHCMTSDQRHGERLLNRIQKYTPTRKARNPFLIHGCDQRTYSSVYQFRRATQFYFAACIAGRP